jgi:hypothetical protein
MILECVCPFDIEPISREGIIEVTTERHINGSCQLSHVGYRRNLSATGCIAIVGVEAIGIIPVAVGAIPEGSDGRLNGLKVCASATIAGIVAVACIPIAVVTMPPGRGGSLDVLMNYNTRAIVGVVAVTTVPTAVMAMAQASGRRLNSPKSCTSGDMRDRDVAKVEHIHGVQSLWVYVRMCRPDVAGQILHLIEPHKT